MPYEIGKRDDKWCVFKEGSDESLGCHDTQEAAQAQIQAIGAASHAQNAWWITVDEMRAICTDCADNMDRAGLSRVNLLALREMPANLLQGLCDKVGDDPGFFTRCKGMSFGDFAPDKDRFCAWLHHKCLGIWPGEHSIHSVGTALRQVMVSPNVGDLLESRIHAEFTTVADCLFGLGYLTKEERIQLSSAIGQGLDAYAAAIIDLGLDARPIDDFEALDIIRDPQRSLPLGQDDKLAYGSALRALGDGKVGGYLVMFSPGGEPKDAYGTYFEADTEYGWQVGENRIALYDHGMDPTLGVRSVGNGWTLRKVDDVGLWVESQLNLADEYEAKIYELIDRGRPDDGRAIMGLSSATAEHLIICDDSGKMRRWIISEGSYTVVPAEPRTRGAVCTLRSYKPTSLKSLLSDSGNRTGDAGGDLAGRRRAAAVGTRHNRRASKPSPKRRGRGGKRTMDITKLIEMLKSKLDLTEEQLATLDLIAESYAMGSGGEAPLPEEELPPEEAMNEQALLSLLKKLGVEVPDEGADDETRKPKRKLDRKPPPYNFDVADAETDKKKKEANMQRAVHIVRHGAIDEPTDLVMREVYGGDYRQALFDQNVAFWRYMRTGAVAPILNRQIWGIRDVQDMLRNGLSVVNIRATMVEGADELGGYAVPPDMRAEILRRMMGLTAVRGGGALIVETISNMVEWIKITGGNSRYPSAMRGQWGDETTAGTADDFTIGLTQIPVNIYSFPVDFSRSILEDAANLEQIFTNLASDTLAIDEDEAFLIGDGANKPRGILPNSANGDSLTEKALSLDGTGSDITVTGVKGLRRGVASQYRNKERASWVANSSTGETIELFQDGQGRFYYEYLESGEFFLRTPWRESEAMPDVAASAYPMIFGDLSGYAIIERLGMAIERFHDSNTGVKKYRFAIYRRLGGHLIEPWKVAVGKVATSV